MAAHAPGRERTGVLKVVQVNNQRRSFRLEPVFWEVLAEMADEAGMRLGRFVDTCLEHVPASNDTSSLRVAAMLKLLRDRAVAGMADEPAFHQQLFDTAPTPALLLSESARILAYNEALITWLGVPAAQKMVGRTLPEAYQVRTRVPWPRLWEMLQTGARDVLRIQLVYSAPGRVTAGEATILRTPKASPYHADALVWLVNRNAPPQALTRKG